MSDNFQLSLLPERKMDWRTLVTSYGLVALMILLLLFARLLWPEQIQFRLTRNVTEIIPTPDMQQEPVQPPVLPQKIVIAKLPPVQIPTPKLVLPTIVRATPKPLPKEIEPPKLEARLTPATVVPVSAARPARLLYTGSFGSSAVATLNTAVEKVQTGGFGDPNGLKPQDKSTRESSATLGSFDMPQGAGHGNGSGGAKGVEGTIASAGFGSGIAQPGHGDGRAPGVVAQTAFDSQSLAPAVVKHRAEAGPATTPIEITFKPKPVYTDEARKLQLQGEVLLEVTFAANGQLHVNRVVRGLGHGLDEAAVIATNNMKFKPAQRNGSPVDLTAVVHVVFELAM